MPLRKLLFKPGVDRERTRYTNEGGWYVSEKVRFRQGMPEKIGGWQSISDSTFIGVCRNLWNWVTLTSLNLLGVGTNSKYYIETGGQFFDITPIRASDTLSSNPFAADSGSDVITVTASAHGAVDGDYVTFTGADVIAGLDLNNEYTLTILDDNSYTIDAENLASGTTTGGGASVVASYQINTGQEIESPLAGWGAGAWGDGSWGIGGPTPAWAKMRLWSAMNWGEDLVYCPRGGGIYYWDATSGLTSRGVNITSLAGSTQAPTEVNFIYVSDISRFLLAFGANNPADTVSGGFDPMVVRWADQESLTLWAPAITNQAGDLRLSHGSEIVTAVQTRQEIFTLTDSAAYSLQYIGAPFVWGAQLLGDNISIVGYNAMAIASGVVFWMGVDKFYTYNGSVQTLSCDLRRYIFSDYNKDQQSQVFAGTNEGFNEVWWFYCSANSTVVDRYVIYNYLDQAWTYGTMERSAWLDSGLRDYPLAAAYNNRVLYHEYGVDDNAGDTVAAIDAYIESAEFDIEDGDRFMYVYRTVPDITFAGSTDDSDPEVVFTIYPKASSGSPNGTPAGDTVASPDYPVDQYTSQIYTRLRGRQAYIKVRSNKIGTTWQLGSPRLDMRPDGRATGGGA